MANQLSGAYVFTKASSGGTAIPLTVGGATYSSFTLNMNTARWNVNGSSPASVADAFAYNGMLTIVRTQLGTDLNTWSVSNSSFDIGFTIASGSLPGGAVSFPQQAVGANFPTSALYTIGNNTAGAPALKFDGANLPSASLSAKNNDILSHNGSVGANLEYYMSAYYPAGMMCAA